MHVLKVWVLYVQRQTLPPPPPPNICERIVKAGTMHLALICSQELCLQAIINVSNPVLLHMTCRSVFLAGLSSDSMRSDRFVVNAYHAGEACSIRILITEEQTFTRSDSLSLVFLSCRSEYRV